MATPTPTPTRSTGYRDYPTDPPLDDHPNDDDDNDNNDNDNASFELRNREPARARYSDALDPPDDEAPSTSSQDAFRRRPADGANSSVVRMRQFGLLAAIAMIFFMFAPERSGRIEESAESHHEAEARSPVNFQIEPAGLKGQVSDAEPPQEIEESKEVVDSAPDLGQVDLAEFCGECHWGMGTSCDGRVQWMLKRHQTPVDEGKAILLRAGQCGDQARKQFEDKKAHEVPTYPCRNSTEDEGGHGVDNFCGYCVWKQTQFDCFTRVKYLMDHYGDSELKAKQGLVDGGECIMPADLKDQEERAKEVGLEEWCGHCSWGPHRCDAKADWYAGDDPVLRVQKQKEIMEGGHCKKAPLCDEVNNGAGEGE